MSPLSFYPVLLSDPPQRADTSLDNMIFLSVINRNNQRRSVIPSCSFRWQMNLFLPTHHPHIVHQPTGHSPYCREKNIKRKPSKNKNIGWKYLLCFFVGSMCHLLDQDERSKNLGLFCFDKNTKIYYNSFTIVVC